MELLDPILICLYRLTGSSLADYFLGTFLLAFLTVLVGEITISVVFRVNKAHLDGLNAKVEKMSRLSLEALSLGERESYKACNKEGNDAFGRLFFNRFSLAAASLWPIFLALAWMQQRFAEIGLPLPLTDWKIHYVLFFLLCYIPARMLVNRLKLRLTYFRGDYQRLLHTRKSEFDRK